MACCLGNKKTPLVGSGVFLFPKQQAIIYLFFLKGSFFLSGSFQKPPSKKILNKLSPELFMHHNPDNMDNIDHIENNGNSDNPSKNVGIQAPFSLPLHSG